MKKRIVSRCKVKYQFSREPDYGFLLADKPKMKKLEGLGIPVPHVLVMLDGEPRPRWVPHTYVTSIA